MSNGFTQSPQFKRGMSVEAWLDKFFAGRGYAIRRTTAHQERRLHLGDRIFTKGGHSHFVEYKSGIQTYYTGNVFLETISVDRDNVPGWVYSSRADHVIYAALLNGRILIFHPARLRGVIEVLKRQFREVKTSYGQNRGYNTYGVIVPLAYAVEHLVDKVIEVEPVELAEAA